MVILGAGVVGLSTAVNVQKFFPDLEVTVIADKFEDETTSDGAAGLFRPTRKKTSGDADIIRSDIVLTSTQGHARLFTCVRSLLVLVCFIRF